VARLAQSAAWLILLTLTWACVPDLPIGPTTELPDAGQTAGTLNVDALLLHDIGDAGPHDAHMKADIHPDAAPLDVTLPDGITHAVPPIVDYWNGGVVHHPHIVTVTFPGNPDAARLAKFGAEVTNSPWWQAVSAGYCESPGDPATCVGTGTDGGAYVLPFAPAEHYLDAMNDGTGDLQPLLLDAIAAAQLPEPVTETMYLVYFPSGVSVTMVMDGVHSESCQTFGAYHHALRVGGTRAMYAIMPHCPGFDLDTITVAASHEIIEAATDPWSIATSQANGQATGYALTPYNNDTQTWLRTQLGGGEVADLCNDFTGAQTDRVAMGEFTVQRSFSNVSAQAGHDPCVPQVGTYFNLVPAKGKSYVSLAPDQSKSFFAFALADGPMPQGWTLDYFDLWSFYTGSSAVEVTFNGQDSVRVHAGDVVQVTVKAVDSPDVSQWGGYGILLQSTDDDGAVHRWPVWVHLK
jgi:hypothetical protein